MKSGAVMDTRAWVLGTTIVGVLVAAAVYACVPADTRPPPGALTLTVSPSANVNVGVTTVDGWNVTFDRVFVALGNSGLSDQCTVYGEADYDRVLDLKAGANQKLGVLHGLGKCDLRFRISPPSTDAVTGAGVTADDKELMQIPARDPYTTDGRDGTRSNGSGTSIDISGKATKDGVTKTFHLVYRRRIRYQRCTPDAPPADASLAELTLAAALRDAGATVDLSENQELTFDLKIEPEAVLRDDVNPSAGQLRFDAFAQADTDGDGVVTLDELRNVPITSIRDAGAFEAGTYDVDDAGLLLRGRPVVIATLGDFIYELLVPTLLRFRDTGWCVGSTGRFRPD